MEVGTLRLGNDKSNVIVDKVYFDISKQLLFSVSKCRFPKGMSLSFLIKHFCRNLIA